MKLIVYAPYNDKKKRSKIKILFYFIFIFMDQRGCCSSMCVK